MSTIDQRIVELGLVLPCALKLPPGKVGRDLSPDVINGFSELIVEVFDAERAAHARSAVGMAELPFDIPVEIEAEVELFATGA